MHRCNDAVINSLRLHGVLRLSFSDKTIRLSCNAQFATHAYIKDSSIGQWFGFRASWLISKDLRWRHIGRSVVNYCVYEIYSLPLREGRKDIERGGSRKPSSCIMEISATETFLQTCLEITNARLVHSTTTLHCQCLPPYLHFYPSHLPPLPNLYVNSLFPKQYNMHIYPLVAETQKSTQKDLSLHIESSHVNHCNFSALSVAWWTHLKALESEHF